MKYKCAYRNYNCNNKFTIGRTYEVEDGYLTDDTGFRRNFKIVSEHWYKFEPVATTDRHELHITSDGTTTNAVYKLNGKVEKTAKAVRCPSDTFNFNTGAELAINRVLYGTDCKPISEDKITSGTMQTMRDPYANQRCTNFVPKQEDKPKHEVVTLYCKQDYGENSHYSITKGNVYSIIDGVMTYDNGVKSNSVYGSFKEYKEWHSDFAACLTKTEKRPAKKGEYILITKSKDTRVKAGDVYKFVDSGSFDEDIFVEHPEGKRAKDGAADISPSEYLVLPDYIPEKVEPTYWSGKVVCTESQNIGATAGKAYSVVNGLFTWNNGVKYSSRNFTSFDNFKEIMKKHATDFIEYLGEQSC